MTETQRTTTGQSLADQLIAEWADFLPSLNEAENASQCGSGGSSPKAPVTVQALADDLGIPARQVDAALLWRPGRQLREG